MTVKEIHKEKAPSIIEPAINAAKKTAPEKPRLFQAILTQKRARIHHHGTTSTLRDVFNLAYWKSHEKAIQAKLTGRAVVFEGPRDIVDTKIKAGNVRLAGFKSSAQSQVQFVAEPLN